MIFFGGVPCNLGRCSLTEDGTLYVVYELMAEGDLECHLPYPAPEGPGMPGLTDLERLTVCESLCFVCVCVCVCGGGGVGRGGGRRRKMKGGGLGRCEVSAVVAVLRSTTSASLMDGAGPVFVWLCCRQVSIDVCDGLLFCHHGCGIGRAAVLLHRDIKPANVLLRRDRLTGRLVGALGDFGISKMYPEGEFARGTTTLGGIGTPGYMAPELHYGDPCSPLSDAYSLGITLLQVGHLCLCVWPRGLPALCPFRSLSSS
jgi:hypothetical protein